MLLRSVLSACGEQKPLCIYACVQYRRQMIEHQGLEEHPHQADKSDPQLLKQLGCSGVLFLVTCAATFQGVLAGALQRIIKMEQALDVLRLLVTSSASQQSHLMFSHDSAWLMHLPSWEQGQMGQLRCKLRNRALYPSLER